MARLHVSGCYPMEGARVGYARCSTDEQDVDIQIEQLTALGVAPERIYIDETGKNRGRQC
jgi:DNA invertase Pin-like site-specific DNA recombinase